MGFIAWFAHSGGQNSNMIMLCEFLIAGIEFRFIAMGSLHPGFEIVRADRFGCPAKEIQCPYMPTDPGCQFLGSLDFGVCVIAGWQGGDKDLCLADLARFRIGDWYCDPSIIHFHFFAALAGDPHGAGFAFVPALIIQPELSVSVPIRIFLPVLLPEQGQGDTAFG